MARQRGHPQETGRGQVRAKRPRFDFATSPDALPADHLYDFAVAQSIFSHAGPDLVALRLRGVSPRLRETGTLVATFIVGEEKCRENGWAYPASVNYRTEMMAAAARDDGLEVHLLGWRHLRQNWVLFSKPCFDTSRFQATALTVERDDGSNPRFGVYWK